MLRTLLLVALVGVCFYRPDIPKTAIDHACRYSNQHLLTP